MFIVDAFIANFNRHNGDWGFLYNKSLYDVKIAPIFDCGSCLYPSSATDESFKNILNNPSKIEEMIYMYPPSRIKNNGVAINNYDFLTRTNNKDCLDVLIKITESINMKEIYTIVNEILYISDCNKEFLRIMLSNRKEKLLEKAIIGNKNIKNPMLIPLDFNPSSALDSIKVEELAKSKNTTMKDSTQTTQKHKKQR